MNWAIAGVVYAVAYVALTIALADAGWTRTLAGNIGLLLPPFALMIAVVRRRGAWRGRQAVFWGAIVAWPFLWFVGQIVNQPLRRISHGPSWISALAPIG